VAKLQINLSYLAFQAEGGDPSAQYRLGILFLLGESVEQDLDAAHSWLKRAGRYRGADLLIEKIARYQAMRLPAKHSGWLESIGAAWPSMIRAVRGAFDSSQQNSALLDGKIVNVIAGYWVNARKQNG
jgi:TPR repeat protein